MPGLGRNGDEVKKFLTDEQNKQFDQAVQHWQQKLNLADWRIARGDGNAKGAMASVSFNCQARLATYRTGDWGNDPMDDYTIRATALHEVLHVLLAELLWLKANQPEAEPLLESAEHRVVNTLEKLLMESDTK